jgi:hypothetical protein
MDFFAEKTAASDDSQEVAERAAGDSDDGSEMGDEEYANAKESSEEEVTEIASPRKSIFKTSRRLSGLPNMFVSNKTIALSEEDTAKLSDLLSKFPEPPDKIVVASSTYSNISSSAAKYLKGFWGSSSS